MYKITGNLTLKGSSNSGNKINFGNSNHVHLYEPTNRDDTLEIKVKAFKFEIMSQAFAKPLPIN